MNEPKYVEGSQGHKSRGWFFGFYEQWSTLFRKQNWNDFTVIMIAAQLCRYADRWEVELALLGFQITITYVYSARFNSEMKTLADSIKDELLARTGVKEVKDPFGVLDKLDEKDGHA